MKRIAVISVNFFRLDVFEAQGFIDNGVMRWAPRKKPRKGKILVKSGTGRASIRETNVTHNSALIIAYAPYMGFHNRGVPEKNLPQRKFMGRSRTLDRKVVTEIDKVMRRI